MTIVVVDWDVKPQTKQKQNKRLFSISSHFAQWMKTVRATWSHMKPGKFYPPKRPNMARSFLWKQQGNFFLKLLFFPSKSIFTLAFGAQKTLIIIGPGWKSFERKIEIIFLPIDLYMCFWVLNYQNRLNEMALLSTQLHMFWLWNKKTNFHYTLLSGGLHYCSSSFNTHNICFCWEIYKTNI